MGAHGVRSRRAIPAILSAGSDSDRNVRYTAAEDPVEGSGAMRAAATAAPMEEAREAGEIPAADDDMNTPVRVDKTPGRNEPCYCGSGKKYKLCHGR